MKLAVIGREPLDKLQVHALIVYLHGVWLGMCLVYMRL